MTPEELKAQRDAERKHDMTYDDWGRANYAAYRAEWAKHHAQLRATRYAAWIADGRGDLVDRLERIAQQLADGDALLAAGNPPVIVVPSNDELPF